MGFLSFLFSKPKPEPELEPDKFAQYKPVESHEDIQARQADNVWFECLRVLDGLEPIEIAMWNPRPHHGVAFELQSGLKVEYDKHDHSLHNLTMGGYTLFNCPLFRPGVFEGNYLHQYCDKARFFIESDRFFATVIWPGPLISRVVVWPKTVLQPFIDGQHRRIASRLRMLDYMDELRQKG